MKTVDLLIKGGIPVYPHLDEQRYETATIAIDKGLIVDIDKDDNITEKYIGISVLEANGKYILPGFVNSHTHVPMSYFKGLADDLPLMEWLSKHIWPIEKKFIAKEFVKDASLHGFAELLKNGITTFSDMYFYGEQTAESAQEIGIRGVIGEGVLDFPTANYQNSGEILSYIEKMAEKYKSDDLIKFAVAPHAIYTCGAESLQKAAKLARKLDLLYHIHVSETEHEVNESLKNFGKRPIHYLNDLGVLEQKTVFAHGVWVDDTEQKIIADKNISVAINTSSNLKLASGFAPVKSYLDNKVNLTLATDGVSSNNQLNMLHEISLTAKVHKALNNDPTLLPAQQVIQLATQNGADALQLNTGRIEVGKFADLITVAINEVASVPLYNIFSHLAYSTNSNQINDAVVHGKVVMSNRVLTNVDENEILNKAEYYRKKIIEYKNLL